MAWSDRHLEAADTLVAAFAADPAWLSVFATPRARRLVLKRFIPPLTADAARHAGLLTAVLDDEVVGAACVWPPGYHPAPRPTPAWLLAGAEIVRQAGVQSVTLLKRWRSIRLADPLPRHWHVALVGVRPQWQGKGVGRALIGAVAERADGSGRPAYLETGRAELVGWYAADGFAVRDELVLPGSRAAWTMWRSPGPRPR